MKKIGSFLKRHVFFTVLTGLCLCFLVLFTGVDKKHYKQYYNKDKYYSYEEGSLYWLKRGKDTELNLSFLTDSYSLQDFDTIKKYSIGGVSVYTTYYKTNKYTLYIFPVEDEGQASIKGTKKDYNTVTKEPIGYSPIFDAKDLSIGDSPVIEMEYGILKHKASDDEAGTIEVLNNYTAYSIKKRDRLYNLIFVSDDIAVDDFVFTNTVVASMEYIS